MQPKEQEIAIGELEDRLDRLRVLYEQYFLGFEKLEPSVPRKDVDRRFMILRKEQIRNTAVRFRFQVVTQRFNTYQMYWQRICRQIEEGTFKRHLQRARRLIKGGKADASSFDVEIDMSEFEDSDVDALLAETDAAVQTYAHDDEDTADTVPPPPPSRGPSTDRSPVDEQLARGTPGTAFAIGRRPTKELDTELDDAGEAHAPSTSVVRAARPAATPAGSKPKIVRRMALHAGGTEPPPSGRTIPGMEVPSPPSSQPSPVPNTARTPAAPTSSPRLIPAVAGSAPKIVRRAAPASDPQPQPSERRIPAAAMPVTPASPFTPAAPQSDRRMPVANPRPPQARLPIPPPSGKLPVAVPPPPSNPRLPNAPPVKPGVRPPASSSPNVSEAASSSKEPKESSGGGAVPSQRPSMRPPPPLPSQLARPPAKKKD